MDPHHDDDEQHGKQRNDSAPLIGLVGDAALAYQTEQRSGFVSIVLIVIRRSMPACNGCLTAWLAGWQFGGDNFNQTRRES